jgi:phosphatidylserine/phosphatidylglycerophosphate/cardiolipin synthase-like enzyme
MRAALLSLILFSLFLPTGVRGQLASAKVRVEFNDKCEPLALREIRRARDRIRGAMYIFTNPDLVDALVDAEEDGVDVQVKVDRAQSKRAAMRKAVDKLRRGGVSVLTIEMPEYSHMHHKFMVIDAETVLTGSYNFTVAASEINYETLLAIHSETVARSFLVEYDRIRSKKRR